MKKIFLFESFKDISLQFVLILLSIIGFITYINAVFHPFVHDDVVFIVKNPAIQELSFKSIFQQTISSDRDTSLINTYYRPLLEFFYRLGYQLFGFNPAGFHFINIFFHIINSFLVFILFNVLWKNQKGMALAASIVFLTHPMQSEAVACISGISNLVFAGLCLLSFILYLYSMETERQKRGETLWYYLLSLLIFALAVLAKEQAIVLPILILWYEVILGENKNTNRRRIRFVRWAGFIFVVSFYFLLRKYVLGITMPNVFGSMPEFFLRMKAVPLTLLTYLGIIFFPLDLHYYRSVDILSPVLGAISILGFILLCVGYLIIRIPAPYKQRIIFGSGWFIIAFGPTLNIVPLINEYSFILTAEHFLYLPFVGILIIAACLWNPVLKKKKKE
ncbi:MAG: glycosyltransferase family 39 protein, partial [Candidatus Omnitrophica bacterium]|nr:glycosyltransferase family 39 protein [Candidatus Omnitrophota bacterium]